MTYQAAHGLAFFALKGGDDAVYGNSKEFAREIQQANSVISAINRVELPAAIPWKNARELYLAAHDLLSGAATTAYEQAKTTTFEAPREQAMYAGNRASRAYDQYLAPIAQMLADARIENGTESLVPSAMLQKNIPRAMEAATRTYEALAYLLDIRPGIVRFMDNAVKLYNKVGEKWAAAIRTIQGSILDPTLEALDATVRWTKYAIIATILGSSAYIIYKGSQ